MLINLTRARQTVRGFVSLLTGAAPLPRMPRIVESDLDVEPPAILQLERTLEVEVANVPEPPKVRPAPPAGPVALRCDNPVCGRMELVRRAPEKPRACRWCTAYGLSYSEGGVASTR